VHRQRCVHHPREGTRQPAWQQALDAGVYRAVLIVYLAPQFQGTAVRLLTYADVRVS